MTKPGDDQPHQCAADVEFTIRLSRTVKKGQSFRRGVIMDSRYNGDIMNGQKFGGEGEPDLSFKSVASYLTMTDIEEWD